MANIHYFNPGHETAILLGTTNYTPPANVRRMQRELALLPIWYANAGDWVYLETAPIDKGLSFLPSELRPQVTPFAQNRLQELPLGASLKVTPWGISPQSLHLLERICQLASVDCQVPAWSEKLRRLSGRQTAAACLDKLRERYTEWPLPNTPRFCRSIAEIEAYLHDHPVTCVLKTPYSSSGRGLLWVEPGRLDNKVISWIRGAIGKQGEISIEEGLDKVLDFALEYTSNGQGEVRYEGLSLFHTESKGAYSGNRLDSQEKMRATITQLTGESLFSYTQEAVRQVLSNIFGEAYTGCIGVDMLVYRQANGSYALHPCVEINMRYTMGYVALRLYQQWIVPEATGHYLVTFDKEPGAAYEQHRLLTERYPLRIEGRRIRSGYLSLCPVTPETHYRAYLLMKE